MTYFIIYEDQEESRELYKRIVLKLVGNKNDHYKIIEIEKYEKDKVKEILLLDGRKIFILDIEVPGRSGLDLAKDIRKVYDDWESQMIIVTNHYQFESFEFTRRLLMLDFVSKYYNCEEHLRDALIEAINILDKNKFFSFFQDGEVFKFPYSSILYIEKKTNEIDPVLVTRRATHPIRMSISDIWKKLEIDGRFFKATRSCIINLYNISSIDFKNQIIKFGKQKVSAISRDNKKELKERIGIK